MILGTQFKSYSQPLLILATVPMAFTGVILGLIVSNNPLSLWHHRLESHNKRHTLTRQIFVGFSEIDVAL